MSDLVNPLGLRGLLFDMDGVFYNSETPIDGAPGVAAWADAHNIPHLFLTNTSSRSRRPLVEKLERFGIPVTADQILTPAVAAASWLRAQPEGTRSALFVVSSTREEFAGLELLPDEAEAGADFVIIGDLGELWDFHTINRAFRLLHSNPKAQLIALGMTRFWMSSTGVALDVAPFIKALEHATGRSALVFGKPAPGYFEAGALRLGLEPSEVLMVGDDIVTDVGGAQAAGLRAAQVMTGKFRPADLEGEVQPLAVFNSVADLPCWWAGE